MEPREARFSLAQALGDIVARLMRELGEGTGPEHWCRRCHRHHKRRAGCGLVLVERRAKSGRTVMRWAHSS